jgi:hypothetical protein
VQSTLTKSKVLSALAIVLVCRTTIAILLAFPDYFPPNFHSDFLLGRSDYFFGPYQWAFYAHILAGPFALLSGLVLLSEPLRRRFPKLHPLLGRAHVAIVLFFLAPTGLWMAIYAEGGAPAAVAFAILALATAASAALGWRAAVQRRFNDHRLWMLRCLALLCSTVLLRLMGGLADVLSIEGTYPSAAWLSWLLPLAALEAIRSTRSSPRLHQ